ncbi:MAG: hypothetical protein WC717_05475 [Candidatus Micrarchaeia archaeon]
MAATQMLGGTTAAKYFAFRDQMGHPAMRASIIYKAENGDAKTARLLRLHKMVTDGTRNFTNRMAKAFKKSPGEFFRLKARMGRDIDKKPPEVAAIGHYMLDSAEAAVVCRGDFGRRLLQEASEFGKRE